MEMGCAYVGGGAPAAALGRYRPSIFVHIRTKLLFEVCHRIGARVYDDADNSDYESTPHRSTTERRGLWINYGRRLDPQAPFAERRMISPSVQPAKF
jgi:hypothetical protein